MQLHKRLSPCTSGNHGDCEGRHNGMNDVECVVCNCTCHRPAKCKYCQEEIRWVEVQQYGKAVWRPLKADRSDFHRCQQYRKPQPKPAPEKAPKAPVVISKKGGESVDAVDVADGLRNHGLWQYQGSDEVTGASSYIFKHAKPEYRTSLMLVDSSEYENSGGVKALVMRSGYGEHMTKYTSLEALVKHLEAHRMIAMPEREYE